MTNTTQNQTNRDNQPNRDAFRQELQNRITDVKNSIGTSGQATPQVNQSLQRLDELLRDFDNY